MQLISLENPASPLSAPLKVRFCDTFLTRLRGLTFTRSLPTDQGILLVQSRESRLDSAIHMFAVWFDLGVIWLDEGQQVVDLKLARAWRPLYFPARPARFVLEIHPLRLMEFHLGDRLVFSQVNEVSPPLF